MNLKTITIQNFRNYKGKHEFHLNDRINILYGNNGNGKSSFFDAIEWCLTAEISRFIKKNKQAIANKHLNVKEECSVEIYFDTYCIRRAFIKTENGFGNESFSLNKVGENGRLINRIATGIDNVNTDLQKIFRQKGGEISNINYKFTDVLKKAYILSQDQVVDFVIRDNGIERYNSLASIMGFEKIVKIRKSISGSMKTIEKKIKNLEVELVQVSEVIEREVSKKRNINYREYEKIKGQIGVDISIEQIRSEDLRLKRSLYEREQNLGILQEIIDKGFKDSNELEDFLFKKDAEIVSLEKTIDNLLTQIQNEEELINRQELTIKNWNKDEKLRRNLKNHLRVIKKYQQELKKINIPVDNFTIDVLKEMKNAKKDESVRLEFTLKYKKELDNAYSFLVNYDEKFIYDNKKFQKYTVQLQELIEKEQFIRNKITHSDNNSSLSKLLNNIEDILEFTTRNNTKGICPVCTSDVGEDLHFKIENNMQRVISSINEDKDYLKQLLLKKKAYSLEIEELNYQIKIVEDSLEELKINKENALENIEFIKKHKLYTNLFEHTYEWIEEKSGLLKLEIANLDLAMEYLRKIEERQNILKEYNIFEEEDLIPFDSIEPIQKSLDLEIKQQKKLKEEVFKRTKELNENKQIKIDYEILLKELKNIGELPVEIEKVQTKKDMHFISSQISILEKSREMLEIERYNKEIDREVEKLNHQKLLIEESGRESHQKKIILNDLLKKLDKEFGDGTAEFLNNNGSSIQRYFRYLNPKPSEYSKLYFDIKENENKHQELAIKIIDENSSTYKVDANMTLSSGQLNVLALSIFIATNEAQVNSYFDFIAIDDPIQNMDDLNRFSICDVLGSLNKQLIFSTHDQEFIRLFLKKNEHRKDNVSVFVLSSDEQKYETLKV